MKLDQHDLRRAFESLLKDAEQHLSNCLFFRARGEKAISEPLLADNVDQAMRFGRACARR